MKQQNLPTKTRQFTLVMAVTVGLILIVALMVGLIPGQRLFPTLVAHAQGTINVTTTNDEYGTNPGACSLREAIESINTNSSFGGCTNPGGADTIQLQADTYTLSILRSGGSTSSNQWGSLYATTSMTIRGVGADQTIITTTASFDDRVFFMYGGSSYSTSIEGVTIQGGNSNDNGGGIYLWNSPLDSTIAFALTDVIIKNNKTAYSGGGMYLGLVTENGMATLTDVVIENNQASGSSGCGGGLYAYASNFTLNNVTVNDNQADYGGGICYVDQYGTVSFQMTNTTIYSNTAQTSGGGFYLDYDYTSGTTVASVINVTFASNRAGTSGGNIYNNNSILNLKNTIVANGTDGGGNNNCAGNPGPNITSQGYNLDSGNTCGLSGAGDIINTDPLLDSALADNGGSTPTLALLAGSPAINKGTCAGAPSTDQRSYPRPDIISHQCDIGAYEYGSGIPIYLPIILKNY
jgi:CSLREA domain-containing protein